MLETPNAIFVSFTDNHEMFPHVNERMRRLAEDAGYEREAITTVTDGNGRPTFEIFRYHKPTTGR